MSVGPFSSESNATTTTLSATDQGQANNKSKVLQGTAKGIQGNASQFAESGSVLVGAKGKAQLGGLDLSNLKHVKGDINVTLTQTTPTPAVDPLGNGTGGGVSVIPFIPQSNEDLNGSQLKANAPDKPPLLDNVKSFFTGADGTVNKIAIGIAVGAIGGLILLIKVFRGK